MENVEYYIVDMEIQIFKPLQDEAVLNMLFEYLPEGCISISRTGVGKDRQHLAQMCNFVSLNFDDSQDNAQASWIRFIYSYKILGEMSWDERLVHYYLKFGDDHKIRTVPWRM